MYLPDPAVYCLSLQSFLAHCNIIMLETRAYSSRLFHVASLHVEESNPDNTDVSGLIDLVCLILKGNSVTIDYSQYC